MKVYIDKVVVFKRRELTVLMESARKAQMSVSDLERLIDLISTNHKRDVLGGYSLKRYAGYWLSIITGGLC